MAPVEHIYSWTENTIFCFEILRNNVENTIYSDLTSRFPLESYTGMNYMLACYIYKLNTQLLCTIKNNEDKEW